MLVFNMLHFSRTNCIKSLFLLCHLRPSSILIFTDTHTLELTCVSLVAEPKSPQNHRREDYALLQTLRGYYISKQMVCAYQKCILVYNNDKAFSITKHCLCHFGKKYTHTLHYCSILYSFVVLEVSFFIFFFKAG